MTQYNELIQNGKSTDVIAPQDKIEEIASLPTRLPKEHTSKKIGHKQGHKYAKRTTDRVKNKRKKPKLVYSGMKTQF